MFPFIVFEGSDGSGKTTQSKLLVKKLNETGVNSIWTREPGGTEFGLKIRELLLSHETESIDPRTEALLFAADRAEHCSKFIRPKLKENIVICDRYIDSSGAYQSAGRDLQTNDIYEISYWASQNLVPDLTFIIDVTTEIAKARRGERSPADRLEAENDLFHDRVRNFMLEKARDNPESYRVIDGSKTQEEVFSEVWKVFSSWYNQTIGK